ncbi:MAG: hypothetical protein H7Z74_09035 [Anaerolineae bacterium]|nr:hypothetical protein [Gemmatimonadaceae bacterium]
MTENDRFDDMLAEAARSYNAPPETPREVMWNSVRQGLEEQRSTAFGDLSNLENSDAKVTPLRAPRRDWLRWAAGMAAALVIGFGIGRWQGADRADVTGSTARGQDTRGSVATASPRAPGSPTDSRPESTASPRAGIRSTDPAITRERSTSSAYQIAAIQHLTQMEVLLTSFRSEAQGGRVMDDQLSVWAADLLGTTRLLIDSPAGEDQRLKRLLEDLELVLAQIAQLGPRRAGQEVEMINEAVEWRNVLPRLRSAIPAGSVVAGT